MDQGASPVSGIRDFPVPAPPLRPLVLTMLPALVIVLVVAWLAGRDGDATALLLSLVVVPAVALLVFAAIRRRRIRLADGHLQVVAGLNTTRVAVDALDLAHARVVSLDAHPEFRPGMRMMGTQFPGYAAGHFRRLDGARSFALITRRDKVLVLPQHDGRRLLLSPEQPRALLEALSAEQGAAHGRGRP